MISRISIQYKSFYLLLIICLHSQTVLSTAMHQQKLNISHLFAHI